MKKLSINTAILGVVLFITPLVSLSQWEMAGGLDGGEINGIANTDSIHFASSDDNGIYSDKNGIWELAFHDISYEKVTTAGSCVFIYDSYYHDNCLRSFDYGENWEVVSNLESLYKLCCIDTVLIFQSDVLHINRSFDYGNTYDNIQLPIQEAYPLIYSDDSLLFIHFNDDDIYKIYYSNDYGTSWDSLSIQGLFSHTSEGIHKIRCINGTFWVIKDTPVIPYPYQQVLVYNSILNEWFDVTEDPPNRRFYNDIIGFNNNILCSHDAYSVLKFKQEDSSWVEFANGSKNVNQFLLQDDKLYCATDQGSYTLDTNGNWIANNSGLYFRNISSINIYNGDVYITANNELFHSTNGGNSFTKNNNAFGTQIITTDSIFYLISSNKFLMSWDQGNSWQSFTDGIENIHYQRFSHFSITPKYYYLGTWMGLYKSSSGSISWTLLENGPFNPEFQIEGVEAIDNTVILGNYWPTGKLYFSNTYGYSFVEYGDNCDFYKIDQTYYLLKDSIFFSDDEALTWDYIPHDYSHHRHGIDRMVDTVIVGGRDIYGDPTLQITYDFGDHWINIMGNLPINQLIYDDKIELVKMNNGRIFAGNPKNGLWYRDDLIVSTPEKPAFQGPEDLSVNVYPFPVKDVLFFEFMQTPKKPISIIMCNIYGEMVYAEQINIVNNIEKIRISHLSTGIYFLSIIRNNQRIVKKIIKH